MKTIRLLLVIPCLLSVVEVQWTRAEKPTGIEETPIVATTAGKVKGKVLESRLGEKFFAFRGIRYAKPPTGSLRFQVRSNSDILPFAKRISALSTATRERRVF